MSGSETTPPLVIGKYKRPRCFRGVQNVPLPYDHNNTAWMTKEIFQEWLLKWDKDLCSKSRKVCLLLDNANPHKVNAKLRAIELVFLPANTTSVIQPCDQGVIRTFKQFYRNDLTKKLHDIVDSEKAVDAAVAAKGITVLDAIHIVSSAWSKMKPETLRNCFKKAGFVRDSGTDLVNPDVEGKL